MDTADFHGDGCFLQNAGLTKDLRTAFVSVVMLTLNAELFKLFLPKIAYKTQFSIHIPHLNRQLKLERKSEKKAK